MHHQPGRLVDDDDGGILIHDRQGHVLGFESLLVRRRLWQHHHGLVTVGGHLGRGRLAVHGNVPGLYPLLDTATGILRHQARNYFIQTRTAHIRRQMKYDRRTCGGRLGSFNALIDILDIGIKISFWQTFSQIWLGK